MLRTTAKLITFAVVLLAGSMVGAQPQPAAPPQRANGPAANAPAAAADAGPGDPNLELRTALGTLSEELAELEQSLGKAEGENRAVVKDQISKKRDEFRDSLNALVKKLDKDTAAGTTDEESMVLANKVATRELKAMRGELKVQLTEIFRHQNQKPPEKADVLAAHTEKLKQMNHHADRLLKRIVAFAIDIPKVGVDNAEILADLDKTLGDRAANLASLVEFAVTAKKDLAGLADPQSDEEKAARTAHSLTLDQKLEIATTSLTETVELLKERNIESREYQKLLISASGEITVDVLDTKVALGLAEQWFNNVKGWLIENGPRLIFKVLVFLFILLLFRVGSSFSMRLVRRALAASRLEISKLLQEFFVSMSGKLVMALGFLVALSQLGVELAPLLAGLGVAGFIVGFALQSTLSNFASGLMILIYRPYDVGDLIEVAGVSGKVSEMTLVSTTIQTLDFQRLVVPNSNVWGDIIRNVTAEPIRRVDLVFGIGYSDDIDKAEKVLEEIVTSSDLVLEEPPPVIKLHTLNESSVDFVVRPWCKTEEYWNVHWHLTREVKRRFDAEGISIPFPQRDVHIYREGA